MRPLLCFAALTAVAFAATPSPVRADATQARAREAGYMGVELREARRGVEVVSVPPGSPAALAGVQPGDVIVRARGGSVLSATTFTTSVRAAGAGSGYPLVLRRGNREVNVTVRLGGVPQAGVVAVGSPAPSLSAQLVMGAGPSDLAQLRGRVVVLDFWASWCGPCRMVMPALDALHQRYAAQGLTVLGVTDEGPQVTRAVGAQLALHYTLASDPQAAARYGITGLPTMVVIDRAGTVRRVTVGADGSELRRLDALIRQLLAEPARP